MQSTCADCPIRCITRPIRSAIVPLTPVSISSKMIVGRFRFCAIKALRVSITRAISPPEAVCATSCSGICLLAVKRKRTASQPELSGRVRAVNSKCICTDGIPSSCKPLVRFSAISPAACWRAAVSCAPKSSTTAKVRFTSASAAAIRASALSIAESRWRKSSAIARSSLISLTWCFFSSE